MNTHIDIHRRERGAAHAEKHTDQIPAHTKISKTLQTGQHANNRQCIIWCAE